MTDSENLANPDEAIRLLKQDIVKGLTEYTSGMIKLLYEQARQKGNVLFSPINVYSALALLHMGADGKSRDELADLMGLSKINNRTEQTHKIIGETLKMLADTTQTNLYEEGKWRKAKTTNIEIANGLFVQEGINLNPSYILQVQHEYHGSISNVDFNKDPNQATNIINEFVAKSTKGRISQIFDSSVARDTRVILISCLYFKAQWIEQFEKSYTHEENFDTNNGHIMVKMMSNCEDVPYADFPQLQFECISLRYRGGDASMFFILPYQDHTLPKFISTLTGDILRQVISERKRTEVHYKVPRMKFKWSHDINDQLTQMGVNEVFTHKANLNNMLMGENLKISQIVHAAEIEVDENGTEASAVTAVKMVQQCLRLNKPKPKPFHLNRPFLLFIYHHKSDSILFMAAVHNPTGV